jgi:hypothetical protein
VGVTYKQNIIELATVTTEVRELSLQVPLASTGPTMPPSSDTFKVAEDAKAMQIDAEGPAKTVQIGADLNPK